jgi:hypothetical protein
MPNQFVHYLHQKLKNQTHKNEEEEEDDEDVIPIHDQKSKLKIFEKIITLISHLI